MKPKILIVEDEILIASELEAILEDLGYDPIGIASDRGSALRLAAQEPDLALVDLNLRDGATGPEIGALLSREHDVGVVFVTANPRMLGNGVEGTIGVLTKPYDAAAIADAIDYALERREGRARQAPPFMRVFNEGQGQAA